MIELIHYDNMGWKYDLVQLKSIFSHYVHSSSQLFITPHSASFQYGLESLGKVDTAASCSFEFPSCRYSVRCSSL